MIQGVSAFELFWSNLARGRRCSEGFSPREMFRSVVLSKRDSNLARWFRSVARVSGLLVDGDGSENQKVKTCSKRDSNLARWFRSVVLSKRDSNLARWFRSVTRVSGLLVDGDGPENHKVKTCRTVTQTLQDVILQPCKIVSLSGQDFWTTGRWRWLGES